MAFLRLSEGPRTPGGHPQVMINLCCRVCLPPQIKTLMMDIWTDGWLVSDPPHQANVTYWQGYRGVCPRAKRNINYR